MRVEGENTMGRKGQERIIGCEGEGQGVVNTSTRPQVVTTGASIRNVVLWLWLWLLLLLLLVQSLLPGGEGCRHGCISRPNHRQRASALRLEGFEETVDLVGASAVVGLLVPYLAVD